MAPLWYRPARQLAMQALYQQNFHSSEVMQLTQEYLAYTELDEKQQNYFTNLLCGVIKDATKMDAAISPLLDRPIDRLDILEHTLLRIGTWELEQDKRLPTRKIIAENVYLAGIFGGTDSYKYINAILHQLASTKKLL